MAQSAYTIANAAGAAVRAAINTVLAAVQSSNSGTAAPTDTRAGMWWLDTDASPPVLRMRNAADDGWVPVLELGTHAVPSAPNLAALSGIGANGLLAKTGAATATARTITGAGAATVTDGDGAAGDPTITVPTQDQAAWDAGTGTVESAISPKKLADAIDARDQQIGVGQTWQTPARVAGTIYENDTGRPILVAITWQTAAANFDVAPPVGAFLTIGQNTGGGTIGSFIVPAGWRYRATNSAGSLWAELR